MSWCKYTQAKLKIMPKLGEAHSILPGLIQSPNSRFIWALLLNAIQPMSYGCMQKYLNYKTLQVNNWTKPNNLQNEKLYIYALFFFQKPQQIFFRFILKTFSFRWSAIFLAMMSHLFTIRDNKGLYTKVAPLLNIFQTAAILEVSLTKMLPLELKFTL